MDYNYHTHTYRCGHASGEMEDYIKRAIKGGIKYMGFSDHMPYICSDGHEFAARVPVAERESYFSEINLLREKYKNKIDIKIGFEMEYYPLHFNIMLEQAIASGAEYLLLGEHFTAEEHPGGVRTITETDSVERLQEYVACVVEGIKSRVFTYVAHPDVINFIGDLSVFKNEMRKICVASKNYNIPLEINFLGIRDKRKYPNEAFWEIVGEERAPVTFGFDAHDVESAFDEESLDKAMELVQKYNLNYIGKPKLIFIQQVQKQLTDKNGGYCE